MATNRAIVWFVLCSLFVCHRFQIDVCLGLDVPSAEYSRNENQNNSVTEVHLSTLSDIIIRVGERLELNCTIVGTKNLSKNYQLSWYHGTKRLAHMTKRLSNTRAQLVIDHVDWNSSGTYICKGTGINNVQPKDVLVRVGEIPGSPRDVWTNNVELRTQIHWTAPSQLGGLPLSYVVKAQCNRTFYPDVPKCGSFVLCESFRILSVPKSDTFKCKAILRLFQGVIYNAYVEARNALGSSRSDSVEFMGNHLNPLLTTPKPASGFSVREDILAGTVKLSWKDAWELRPFLVQYTIRYHRNGDSYNKTLIVHSPRTDAVIHNLSGFNLYYFYLLIQYGKTNITNYSDFSDAAVQTLQTKVAAPSRPPTILNCSEWSSLSNLSGLIVTWEIPTAEYQNGPLKDVIIFYVCQRGLHQISGNLTVSNVTARSTTIRALQPSDRCHVWMKTCNGPRFCSGISNTCTVRSLKGNYRPTSGSLKESIRKTVAIVVGTIGGVALVVFVLWYVRSRRRSNEDRPQPLTAVLEEVFPSVHGYDEIDEQSVNNNYDVVDV